MTILNRIARWSIFVSLGLIVMVFLPFLSSRSEAQPLFNQINLVTNDPAANTAQITDPHLVNAWGISFSATSPFWVSDNGSGLSTLYRVDPATNVTSKVGLEVSIPGDGSVTGQVFNGNSTAFNGNNFLFVSENGTISGWRGALGTTAETLQLSSPDNVYKGTTEATIGTNTYLYAANFRAGTIDVLKGTAAAPDLNSNFTDPNLPAGYAPFNIQLLGGKLYVTYALQGSGTDEQAGPGLGLVNVFDTQGNFLGRVGSNGTLNAPWGLAIAPSSFGSFAGDLLVGNFGDGTINAFDLSNDSFVGQLLGLNGSELTIDGLWGLTVGNNNGAGSSDKLYFSAGPDGETNGLFGVIQNPEPSTVPEPSTMLLFGSGLIGLAGYGRKQFFKK